MKPLSQLGTLYATVNIEQLRKNMTEKVPHLWKMRTKPAVN